MTDCLSISSESSEDTIILSESETKTVNIDDILKKYASGEFDSGVEIKTAEQKVTGSDFNDFSDDEWINEPLSKRLKGGTEKGGDDEVKLDDFYTLPDDSCDLEYIKVATNYKSDDEEDVLGKFGRKNTVDEHTSKDSDDVDNLDAYMKALYEKYDIGRPDNKEKVQENEGGSSTEDDVVLGSRDEQKMGSKLDKEQRKLEKEAAKKAKEQQRIDKETAKLLQKQEQTREKALKEALRTVEKNMRPEECMKLITVNIDDGVFGEVYGDVIRTALDKAEINYRQKTQIMPNLISWTRKVQTVETVTLVSKEIDENNVLLLMNARNFVKLVDENSLIGHVQSIYSMSEIKQLSLGVFGLADYYKSKNAKKNETLQRVEYALAELQIMCSCYFRALEKLEDVPLFILECTKAVAQMPFKLKKREKYEQANEYYAGVNKDCVRVDKNGNGLSRLWTQILTMFPMARLETAEAITALYPNPKLLFQAYEQCATKQEAEKLLQDLQVRRAAGPFSTVRKIGPELSKKIYHFFCARDDTTLL